MKIFKKKEEGVLPAGRNDLPVVKIKLLDGFMPKLMSEDAAGYDLYIPRDTIIPARKRFVVKMGFKMQLPKGYKAEIHARSGYSANGMECYLAPANCNSMRRNADSMYGLIEDDYRGEVGVIIKNCSKEFWLRRGQRIAQMVISKKYDVRMVQAEELDETERGEGGFGHTGV